MPQKTRSQPPVRPAGDSAGEGTDQRLARIWRQAYEARGQDDLRTLYAEWAESYDSDHERVGFFGHRLTAEVLARYVTRVDTARVLDAGAGTGAAGTELARLGFGNLTAVDLSEEMLARAQEKGVYSATVVADLSRPLDRWRHGVFDAAVMVGVFSYGQAPAAALDEVLRLVRPGGVVAFTMRTDFFEQDPMGIRERIEALEQQGAWAPLEVTEPMPYLPNKDPEATFRVWCYRVTKGLAAEIEAGFGDAVRAAFEGDDPVKRIDHAWIWDSAASRLYDRYIECPAYYLVDSEEEILREHADEIWRGEPTIVELGCGSARKIRHVLDECVKRSGSGETLRYVPVDVSAGALEATAKDVEESFGDELDVHPRQGLFEDVLGDMPDKRKVVLFFGSSIGNFETLGETIAFLERLRGQLGPQDRFIVGIDLHKDEQVLQGAYNRDVTCRDFFVHMLRRVNHGLGADFDPRVFELRSTYEPELDADGLRTWRMNLRVGPTERQRTYVEHLDMEVELGPEDAVQVGVSRKYEPEAIGALAALAGFRLERQWFDRRGWFSLNELVPVEVR